MNIHKMKNRLVQAIILGSIFLSAPAWAVCGSTSGDSGQDFEIVLLDVLSSPSNDRFVVGQMETLQVVSSVWNCGPENNPARVQIEYLLKREGQSDAKIAILYSGISDPISKNTGQLLFSEIYIPLTIPPGDYVLSAVVQPADRKMITDHNPDNNIKEIALSIIQENYDGEPPTEHQTDPSAPPELVLLTPEHSGNTQYN